MISWHLSTFYIGLQTAFFLTGYQFGLRRTKRHIRQDIEEWDEANDFDDDKPDGFFECSMQGGDEGMVVSKLLCTIYSNCIASMDWLAPSPQLLVLGTAVLTAPGVLGCQADVKPEETQIIAEETPEAKQELMKLGFPEPEGDKAPSALVPKACAVLQKQGAKITAVLQPFQAATSLTEFQSKNLILASSGMFGINSENS